VQASFLREWLERARFPAPILLETNGMLPKALAGVIDLVDIVSMDIKLPSNTHESQFWEQHRDFARGAGSKKLYTKILVDGETDPTEFARAVALIAEVDADIPLFIQPIADSQGVVQASEACLIEFHAMARRSLRQVRMVPQIHRWLGFR
jgi:organic radical activating enzyme